MPNRFSNNMPVQYHTQLWGQMQRNWGGKIMTETATEAARMLAEARRSGKPLTQLPDDAAPRDVAEGYAVQDAFRHLWDDRIVGWKIGATAPAIQALFGIAEPFFGPVFAAGKHESPANLDARKFTHHCIESEFAFRIAKPLATRSAGYGRDEILDAIDAVIPAIELIDPRFERLSTASVACAIADCGMNAGIVLGQPETDWRRRDLPAWPVKLSVDGIVRAEGTGADVLGDPLKVLDWAVNALSRQGIGLEAGHLVLTGTCTGLVYAKPGERIVADFGALGRVEVVYGL